MTAAPARTTDTRSARPRARGRPGTALDRSCRRAAAGGFAVVLGSCVVIAWRCPSAPAWPLVVAPALVVWSVVVVALARARDDAGTGDGVEGVEAGVAPPLGLATHLTLARGALVSLVAAFWLVRPTGVTSWLPGVFYAAAAITDQLDGRVARRLGQVSRLGARLDVAMDGLGLLVAPLVAVAWGRLPPWYLLVGAAYYLFHGGIWIRRRAGWPVYPERLKRSRVTRFFAGVQMGLVAVALLAVMSPARGRVAASLLMLPTLLLFARDWRVVTRPAVPTVPAPSPAPAPALPGTTGGSPRG